MHKRATSVILFLIPVIVCLYFRSYSIYLPAASVLAKKAVYERFRSETRKNLDAAYPDLPSRAKERLVDYELRKKDNRALLKKEIGGEAAIVKSRFQDEYNRTYLLELDPYHWLRLMENILRNGHIGDSIKGGKAWDDYMLAPLGMAASKNLHIWVGYFFHKFVALFNQKVLPAHSFFYLPLFLSAFSVALAYLVIKRAWGNVAAFFGAFMLAVFPFYMRRTMAGFSDTDAYNVIFPFLIIGLLLEAYCPRSTLRRLFFAALGGLAVGLYSLFWNGWWYTFDLALIAMLCYFMDKLERRGRIKDEIFLLFTFFLFSAASVSIFTGLSGFPEFVTAPFKYAAYRRMVMPGLWPNVFATVSELAKVSFSQILADTGGAVLFVIPIIGILISTIKRQYCTEAQKKFLNFLLILWLAVTIQVALRGVRFMLFLAPVFSVGFGIGAVVIRDYVSRAFSALKLKRWLVRTIGVVLLTLFFLSQIACAHNVAMGSQIPIMTDGYWGAFMKLRTGTARDAIVTSGWDVGHLVKYAANRRVTYDGMTQNTPVTYWTYSAFLSQDEERALGIFRMLDCGSNSAFERLNEYLEDTAKSVDLLLEAVEKDKNAAAKVLERYLPAGVAGEVLKYTHGSPCEGYVLVDTHMAQTAPIWAHYGGWDFRKASLWLNARNPNREQAIQYIVNLYGARNAGAESLFYELSALDNEREADDWISPHPRFISVSTRYKEIGNSLVFENGAVFDKEKCTVWVKAATTGIPRGITYLKDGELIEKEFPEADLPYYALLIARNEKYECVLVDPALYKSVFTRLYFLRGHGLRHFELFWEKETSDGGRILIYRICWPKEG